MNKRFFIGLFAVVALAIGFSSCSKDDDEDILSPAEILSSVNWITTKVTEKNGTVLALDDPKAISYVGYAYYKKDGKFRITNLDDSPKIAGTWAVSPDGKTRTLVVYNATGGVQFVRDVEILALTSGVFTYRIVVGDTYYDVEHKPTNHAEPK